MDAIIWIGLGAIIGAGGAVLVGLWIAKRPPNFLPW